MAAAPRNRPPVTPHPGQGDALVSPWSKGKNVRFHPLFAPAPDRRRDLPGGSLERWTAGPFVRSRVECHRQALVGPGLVSEHSPAADRWATGHGAVGMRLAGFSLLLAASDLSDFEALT